MKGKRSVEQKLNPLHGVNEGEKERRTEVDPLHSADEGEKELWIDTESSSSRR